MARWTLVFVAAILWMPQCGAHKRTAGTPTFPSLSKFLKGPDDSVSGQFNINSACAATVSKVDSTFQSSFTPPDCLSLDTFLTILDPKSKGNFDMGSDFMVLHNIIIRSFSFDTATKKVEVAASYTGTITIIPGVMTLQDVSMQISYVSSQADKWKFDISAKITIGSVSIDVNVVRNDEGYFLSASSQQTITITQIASMFQTSDSVLPNNGLETELSEANFSSFGIQNPRLSAVFTDGYGFLFGGKVIISDWSPIDVNVLINKPNDGVLSVTIAVYTPSFSIAKMFNDVFKIDIASVPVIGTAEIDNLALIISTQDVDAPLTLLDIGNSNMFELPYKRGVKVKCDLQISDKFVAISLVITSTEFTLSVSNPGSLTLQSILNEFLSEESTIVTGSGDTATLNNWPSFIQFNPLAISLSNLGVEANNKDGSGWKMSKLDIKLIMTEPIVLFNDIITISDLSFEMAWRKEAEGDNPAGVSGLITGSVILGATSADQRSPKADISIPFPFNDQEVTFTFTDFSISSIASAFGFTIPEGRVFTFMTQIQLDLIALSFNSAGKLNKISVKCSLPQVWPVFGTLSVGNMKLSIVVDNLAGGSGDTTPSGGNNSLRSDTPSSPSERQWEFIVSGHVIISSCDITVSTTISTSSVQVEGKGTNCDVSIAHLLNSISVNPSDFPQFISGFTLSEPAALFFYSNENKAVGFGATTNLFGRSDVEIVFKSSTTSTAIVAGFAVQSVSNIPEISFLGDIGLTDIIVLYVSKDVTLEPYTWRKDVFTQYAPTNEVLKSGLLIKAKFQPSDDNLMGKLLNSAGQATIEVSLRLPDLVFELVIAMPNGGIALDAEGKGKFVSMGLVISKRLIGLSLTFRLELEDVNLEFTGELQFTFGGTVTISLMMEGHWNEPFGITGFVIKKLGLALGINVVTLVPSFGLTGEITVTPHSRDPIEAGITICVDIANPSTTVFDIHFTRLLLADIVNLFLNRDVALPDDIGNMGFPSEVRIFFSPAGNDRCFGETYKAGVKISGTFQIPFLQVYAEADIEVGLKPFQLKADLKLHPINYGNGILKIVSAESDDKGPFLKMNIGNANEFLIDGSCKVVLFGASMSISLTINKEKLHFRGELNLWNLFMVSLEVTISYGLSSPEFHVIGEMRNDLFAKLKTRAAQGIRSGARTVNQKIDGAQSKIRAAQREVDKLLGNINYHKQQIQNAKNDCSRAPWYRKWVCIGSAARIAYHGLAIGGIYVAYGIAQGVLATANLFLDGVKGLIKIGADLLAELVNAVLSIIDIKYVRFEVDVSSTKKMFSFESEIVILGRWTLRPSFEINFSSSQTAEADINGAGDKISDGTMEHVE